MSPGLEKLETGGREERIKQGGGRRVKMTPNTSVLTLSAATTHNHKNGHVQMSLKCRLAACGNVSRPCFFYMQMLVGIFCRLAIKAVLAG